MFTILLNWKYYAYSRLTMIYWNKLFDVMRTLQKTAKQRQSFVVSDQPSALKMAVEGTAKTFAPNNHGPRPYSAASRSSHNIEAAAAKASDRIWNFFTFISLTLFKRFRCISVDIIIITVRSENILLSSYQNFILLACA